MAVRSDYGVVEGKRFEDTVSVEDLMNKPSQELLAEIYVQTLKTNGTVTKNCVDIKDLQIKMEGKIGVKELLRFEKLFGLIAGIAGFLLLLFNIWDRVML